MTAGLSLRFSDKKLSEILGNCLLLLCFYFYFWLYIETRLIYHGAGEINDFPLFYKGWAFLWETLWHAGGPGKYVSAFLVQLFNYSWLGAAIITIQAWLMVVCVDSIIKAVDARRLRWLRYVPMIALLIVYSRYYLFFVETVSFLAALGFIVLYISITSKKTRLGLVLALILPVIVYYAIAGGFLVFSCFCVVYELLYRRSILRGLLQLIAAVLVPYVVGCVFFGLSITKGFFYLSAFPWRANISWIPRDTRIVVYVVYVLYVFVPLTVFLWCCCRFFGWFSPKPSVLSGKAADKAKKHDRGHWNSLFSFLLKTLFPVILFAITVQFARNEQAKTFFATAYYSDHKMWDEILKGVNRRSRNFHVVYSVNQALYHTNRLSEDMFVYPQRMGTLLLYGLEGYSARWRMIRLYYDLGLVNMAEHELVECLEIFNQRPFVLKHLALVNMAKGNISDARIYLNLLKRTLFDSDWSQRYLDLLETDPSLSTDTEIQHVRSFMIEPGGDSVSLSFEDLLKGLLQRNRHNRMAFEYLMAFYLEILDLDSFAANINKLEDFDYKDIPRSWEEALLIHQYRTNKKINLHGREISSKATSEFNAFNRTFILYNGDKRAALRELARNHGDSYFFYHIYKFSGVKR